MALVVAAVAAFLAVGLLQLISYFLSKSDHEKKEDSIDDEISFFSKAAF